jgi:aminoglycoside phosphotransferase family enzyme
MAETDAEIVLRVRKAEQDSMLSSYFQKGLDGRAIQSELDSLAVAVAAMVAASDPE